MKIKETVRVFKEVESNDDIDQNNNPIQSYRANSVKNSFRKVKKDKSTVVSLHSQIQNQNEESEQQNGTEKQKIIELSRKDMCLVCMNIPSYMGGRAHPYKYTKKSE